MRALPWADETEKQLSMLAHSGCELSADVRIFGEGLQEGLSKEHPMLRLKFEVARQASSPTLCTSVRAVPLANEPEQELSRLALSSCEQFADVSNFGAGLPETAGTNTQSCL